jgi:hypothetical protein
MGSYNWSKGAASNSEDFKVVTSPKSLKRMRDTGALSIRFADASQWCRR